ncbi:MAG: TlpA disulfide reductase family protein [Candidatus Heimdallarchaeota archaeon]
MKRKASIILILIFLIPLFFSSTQIITTEAELEKIIDLDSNNLNEFDVGDLASDFNITDVDTREDYSLSDFAGKVVLIDLWATWCGPCEVTIPYMRDIWDILPHDVFQIISIDVDEEEPDQMVSDFRNSNGMDWIVGIDYDSYTDTNYSTGYIPTFYLIDQIGEIKWKHIGSQDFWTLFWAALEETGIDTDAPYFNSYDISIDSELSIFVPTIAVEANITDYLGFSTLSVIISSSTEDKTIQINIEKTGNFYIMDKTLTLDPEFIYGESNIEVKIKAIDHVGNANTTTAVSLPVTAYVDAGPPVLNSISISYEIIDETKFKVTIIVEITEDLLITTAVAKLQKEGATVKSEAFEPLNATHMSIEATILNSLANPEDLVAVIHLVDVAGNEIEESYSVVPGKTSISWFLPLIAIILPVILLRFRKRK